MPTWKPSRTPDKYPANWHTLLTLAPGKYVLASSQDEEELARVKRKFHAFCASLRNYNHHPTAKALSLRQTRLRVRDSNWPGDTTKVLWLETVWSRGIVEMIEEGR